MPWQDNNSGNQGPWGQPPRGGGNKNGGGRSGGEPPDLEELLQASRQRLKRVFPSGGGGSGDLPQLNGRMIGLAAIALALLWAFTGIYTVGPQEQGVKTTFGKFAGMRP